jgi:hypothetical protein
MVTVQVQLRDVDKVYKPTNIVFGAHPVILLQLWPLTVLAMG